MKGMYIFLIVILSILFLGLGSFLFYGITRGTFSIGPVERIEANIRKEASLSMENMEELSLNSVSSNVYIRESEDNQIRLVQYANAPLKEKELFTTNKTNRSVEFKVDRRGINIMFFNYINTVFELYIPKDYCENLNIENVSGKIVFENDICAKKTYVSTTSGRIETKTFAGDAEIKSVSGSLDIGNIEGKATLKTTSGSIRFAGIHSDAYIKSTSGSIKGETLVGKVEVETTSGRIEVTDLQITGDSNFKSVSGSVHLTVSNSNCEIKTKTTSGSVHLPNDSAIIGNSPYNSLNIKTTSGSINISSK